MCEGVWNYEEEEDEREGERELEIMREKRERKIGTFLFVVSFFINETLRGRERGNEGVRGRE